MVCVPGVVDLEGDKLVWRVLEADVLYDTGGLLGRFVALCEAPNAQIAAFARVYGVLGLCEHERPWPHVQDMPAGHLLVCPWVRRGPDGGQEPLAAWRGLAREASALLEEIANRPDLSALHLDAIEDRWLKPAHVRLGVDGGRPCFAPLAGLGLRFGLFGALAVQLLSVGLGALAVRKCDGCYRLFFEGRALSRRPATRVFCEACRGRKARSAASRDYRARKKR